MVSLKLQKRLAAAVLGCGKKKVWLDPNEINDISMANSRALFYASSPSRSVGPLCSARLNSRLPFSQAKEFASSSRPTSSLKSPLRSTLAPAFAAVTSLSARSATCFHMPTRNFFLAHIAMPPGFTQRALFVASHSAPSPHFMFRVVTPVSASAVVLLTRVCPPRYQAPSCVCLLLHYCVCFLSHSCVGLLLHLRICGARATKHFLDLLCVSIAAIRFSG